MAAVASMKGSAMKTGDVRALIKGDIYLLALISSWLWRLSRDGMLKNNSVCCRAVEAYGAAI